MSSDIDYIELTLKDESRWNSLLINGFHASYRASMSYEYSKKHIGRVTTSFIFLKNSKDIAGAHYSLKRTVAGLIKTTDILSGIVFKNEPDEEILSFILEHFITWAKDKKASFIRFNPWIPAIIQGQKPAYTFIFEKSLIKYGFLPLTKGRSSYWIDLTLSEEELLQNMKPGTRSKVRKAMNSDIEVEVLRSANQQILHDFWMLYSKLGKKKNFSLLSEKRFKNEVTSLLNFRQAELFIFRFRGIIVNIALASNFGHSMYFHGALNPEYKTLEGCPAPGHFAQWAIIRHMKSLGLMIYDMAFCPGPIPEKNHHSFDMWRFKYGFGGKHIQFMPTYGKILHPITGRLFQYWRYRK